jgi:hypothetical protein
VLAVAVAVTAPVTIASQVVAEPILRGRALNGDTTLSSGVAVLHHLSEFSEGEVDSIPLGADGSFEVLLPNVPDPSRGDIFFVSIRHDGVLYFGSALNTAAQLDSIYTIQTYDTVYAPAEGLELPVQVRNLFFEPEDGRWRIMDLFQLRNDDTRTLVTRDSGIVWRYPLVEGATDFDLGQGELSPEAVTLEDGDLVVRAPLPPGERLFVVQYWVDDPFVTVPTPGMTKVIEVLVREPAPLTDIEGLDFLELIELETGSTYRRYSADSLTLAGIRLVPAEIPFQPPVGWLAVILGMLLAGFGAFAISRREVPVEAEAGAAYSGRSDRRSLLVAVARLDEGFESLDDPTGADQAQYERQRMDLLRCIRRTG